MQFPCQGKSLGLVPTLIIFAQVSPPHHGFSSSVSPSLFSIFLLLTYAHTSPLENPATMSKCLTPSVFPQSCLTTCTSLLQPKPAFWASHSHFPLLPQEVIIFSCLVLIDEIDSSLFHIDASRPVPLHCQCLWARSLFPYIVVPSTHFLALCFIHQTLAIRHLSIFYTLISYHYLE